MPYLLDSDWVIHALAGRSRALSALERLLPGTLVSASSLLLRFINKLLSQRILMLTLPPIEDLSRPFK
jgi:hypothetical protein